MKFIMQIQKGLRFLTDCKAEFKAITWPTPRFAFFQFTVVLVLSSLLVLILYVLDLSFASLINDLKHLVLKSTNK